MPACSASASRAWSSTTTSSAPTQRIIRGIEVSDETLSLETIRDACIGGPGHYLGSDQTLALMQRDYIYPAIGDRTSPKEWAEQGRTDIVDKAIKKVREILGGHFPAHVPEAVDDEIRAKLPIRLARERMRPRPAQAAE